MVGSGDANTLTMDLNLNKLSVGDTGLLDNVEIDTHWQYHAWKYKQSNVKKLQM